ncbi:hypothetical protein [Pyrobaculum sp.]
MDVFNWVIHVLEIYLFGFVKFIVMLLSASSSSTAFIPGVARCHGLHHY